MQGSPNLRRPVGSSYRGPRTLGGLVVYLLTVPAFVAVLAAPELVLGAVLGAFTAVAVRRLRGAGVRERESTRSLRRALSR